MRSRDISHQEIGRIRDRTMKSLFRARRDRLQDISKDNLRIYQKISTQKSNYSTEHRQHTSRQNKQNQRSLLCKPLGSISSTPCGSTSGVRSSVTSILSSNLYTLPSLNKEWQSIEALDTDRKTKESQQIERTWLRLKNKFKMGPLFLIH